MVAVVVLLLLMVVPLRGGCGSACEGFCFQASCGVSVVVTEI
jgi:hypothetical protein